MHHILKVKNYKKSEFKLQDIAQFTDSYSLDTYIKSIYYCANHLFKLFDNLKIDELPVGLNHEKVLYEKTLNSLDKYNSEKERNCFINFNNVIFNENTVNLPFKKIEIIGNCPNPFIDNNLGFEFILLHKAISEAKKSNQALELSDYGKNLIRLCEQLTNKKFSEIVINEEFISNLLLKYKENYDLIITTKKVMKSYSQQLDVLNDELEDLNKKINQLEKDNIVINDSLAKKNHVNILELKDAEEKRNELITSACSIVDKAKIKMFETFNDLDAVNIIIKEKEINHASKYTRLIVELKKEQELIQNNYIINEENFKKKLLNLNKKIESVESFKKIIVSYLDTQNKQLITMQDKILNINAVDESVNNLRQRNITKISKENNVFFVHSTESWDNKNDSQLRLQSVRFLNPTLNTIPYKLNNKLFENKTNNEHIFGILISKGILSESKNKNTNIIQNNNQMSYSLQEQTNKNNGMKEIFIENTQAYGYICQIDYAIKLNELNPEKNQEVNLDFIKKSYKKLIELNELANKYNIEPLPIIFMVNGKLLEIIDTKEKNYIIQERRLNNQDAESIVKELFVVKQIKSVNELEQQQIIDENDVQNLIKDIIIKMQEPQKKLIEHKGVMKMSV